jgi:hypothetical protein
MNRLKTYLIGIIAANPVGSVIVIAGLVFALFITVIIIWANWQTTSKNEQKADDARSNSEVQSVNTAVSDAQVERITPTVTEAEKTSHTAVNRAKKAREKVSSNVNISEVIRLCEEAYGKGECG